MHTNNSILVYCILGTTNYLCSINTPDLQVAKLYAEEPDPPVSLMFLEAANELMVAHGLLFPVTVQDAVCVYAELVGLFEAQI